MLVRVHTAVGRGVLALAHGRALAAAGVGLWLGLTLAGCRRPAEPAAPEVTLKLAVTPDPPLVGPATVVVTVTDPGGRPVTGAAVDLEGNMSHPGMSPVAGRATETGPGRYEAPLEFTMAGDWVVTVGVTLADGRTLQKQLDVRGVRTG